jgi:hypothetical protein
MKKYVVIRVLNYVGPSVIFSCDEKKDADTYAEIMSRQDGYEYVVAESLSRYQQKTEEGK